MNSEIKLPHDIARWDKAKIENYLEKTRQKKSNIEDWIFEKRQILREHKDLQEAFLRLRKRWDLKIKHLEELLSTGTTPDSYLETQECQTSR